MLADGFDAQLVLIRGLPGSGKTTLAREIALGCGYVHLEGDMYFEGETGYEHERDQIDDAQRWCFRATRDAVVAGTKVVVTGVFSKPSQFRKYLDLTSSVLVIECTGDYGSTHDVPEEVLARMKRRWKPYHGALRI